MRLSRSSISNFGKVWALVDVGKTSLETQCLGIVEAMDFPGQLHRVSLPWVWQILPSCLIPNILSKVHSTPKPLMPPWPTFVICGGKVAVKIGSFLKKKHNVFVVSFESTAEFSSDKIIVQSHEISEKKNNIMTFGPLHRIQPEVLLQARKTVYRKIDHLPKPRVGVFLQGDEPLEPLINQLTLLYKTSPFSLMIHGGNLPEEAQNKLKAAFEGIPHILWSGQGEDPYLGFLSHSDAIIVSNSSSLMVAEATSVGKPLFIYPVSSLSAYIETLLQKGYAFLLQKDSFLFPRFMLPPLQETQRVANILKEAYFKSIPSSLLNL